MMQRGDVVTQALGERFTVPGAEEIILDHL
jgi:hypothetical protein